MSLLSGLLRLSTTSATESITEHAGFYDECSSCKPDAPSECARVLVHLYQLLFLPASCPSLIETSTKTEANRAGPVCSIEPGFGGLLLL